MKIIHLTTMRIFNIIPAVFLNTVRLEREDNIEGKLIKQIIDIEKETLN